MAKDRSLYGFQKENGALWIRNYVVNARIEKWYKIQSLLHYEKSPYQEISIVDSKGFGRMLILDGTPQVSQREGFIYNEMISHIPIVTHPNPKKMGMIGGGDCGPAREAMKYHEIEQIDVVELDPKVTEICRKWLTPASIYENEPRFNMIHDDGLDWIQKQRRQYDILLIDRPDPVGPGAKLFTAEFYKYVYDSLTDDGLVVFQSGSPFYNISTLQRTVRNVKSLFPLVYTYIVTIPLFPCGIWSFTLASKKWDPLKADLSRLKDQETKYIDQHVFQAAFTLPKYVKKIIDEASQ
nr:polyamine aminopropyltransferase [uncultured Bacillus sp.]